MWNVILTVVEGVKPERYVYSRHQSQRAAERAAKSAANRHDKSMTFHVEEATNG